MAKAGYPKRMGPAPYKDAVVVYGVCFAVVFAIVWFLPFMIWILLIGPVISLLFERDRWRGRLSRFAFAYVVIAAAALGAHLLR